MSCFITPTHTHADTHTPHSTAPAGVGKGGVGALNEPLSLLLWGVIEVCVPSG